MIGGCAHTLTTKHPQLKGYAPMSATPALLAASAGVGFGHAILPDHWVPLAVLGRTRRYSLKRVARLSGPASPTSSSRSCSEP
jgi:hypothetical protein